MVAPKIRDHLIPCFDDFLFSYTQVGTIKYYYNII